MSPFIIMVSSGAEYFKTNTNLVAQIAETAIASLPKDTVFVTGGVKGPAFDFARYAASRGAVVHHMIPHAGWTYTDKDGKPEYGLVKDAVLYRIGNNMQERLEAMANAAHGSILIEGGLGSLEEALIVHKNGGANVFFPWLGDAGVIMEKIKRKEGIPRPPVYMRDGYEEVMAKYVPDLVYIDVDFSVEMDGSRMEALYFKQISQKE
jgi:hypothetical protein